MPTLTVTRVASPVGELLLGASERGVCLLEFANPDRRSREIAELEGAFDATFEEGTNRHLEQLAYELDGYFAGRVRSFSVALDTPGTAWQRRVWDALVTIPCGETSSYGALAEKLGSPGAARAVGLANGQNRVAIVVACHRVIGAGGALVGYGGGVERKRWLLDHEAAMTGSGTLFTPAGSS